MNPGQAKEDPKFEMVDDKFGMIQTQSARAEAAKKAGDSQPQQQSKYAQAHIKQSFIWHTLYHSLFSMLELSNMISSVQIFDLNLAWQSKEALKKVMDALISRTGKLRQLVRDLETKYDDTAASAYVPQYVQSILGIIVNHVHAFRFSKKQIDSTDPAPVWIPHDAPLQVRHILEIAGDQGRHCF